MPQSKISPHVWADLILVLVAVIWGGAFVAQRTAMAHVQPFTFAAARFALGALTLLPILGWQRLYADNAWVNKAAINKTRAGIAHTARGGVVLGLLLFGGASFQQIGLVYTSAGKGGFITGLYIVMVPLALAGVWRERISWNNWLGAGLAVVGLFLLSAQSNLQLAPGDGWVLVSAFLWTLHVIAIGRLAPAHHPLVLALIQYFICSLCSAAMALVLERGTWDLPAAWISVVYTGVFSIGAGYTLQLVAQRYTSPTHAAIILSLESVFAALTGWLLLGEVMTPRMTAGAVLMLAGILTAQIAQRA